MSDDFSGVTAAISPANPISGQTFTVTISGQAVHTDVTTGELDITLHMRDEDGATFDMNVTSPYEKHTPRSESVVLTGASDAEGRTYTVTNNGLSVTATA